MTNLGVRDSPATGPDPLVTDRLTLTVPVDRDVEHVFRIHADPRTYRHHPDGLMKTIAEARSTLSLWKDDWAQHHIGYRLIRLADTGTVIGFAGTRMVLSPGFSSAAVLNLYYRIDPDHWRRGYAVEAAAAVIQEAVLTHPAVPVVARIALENDSSLAVARSLGLTPTSWQDPEDPVPHRIFRSSDTPWTAESTSGPDTPTR